MGSDHLGFSAAKGVRRVADPAYKPSSGDDPHALAAWVKKM